MGSVGGLALPGATEQLQPQFICRFLEGQSGVTIKQVACGDLFTACLTGTARAGREEPGRGLRRRANEGGGHGATAWDGPHSPRAIPLSTGTFPFPAKAKFLVLIVAGKSLGKA